MDGIHDLGGVEGFGPVEVEPDEPWFHHEWERRVMRAVSATRFRPAQHNGAPVAVNLIWLFEQTTVKGKSGKI